MPEPPAARIRTGLVRFGLLVAAVYTRSTLADLEPWGVDEAVNLWLGAEILAGRGTAFGLVSSMGARQLAGAPLVAAPLTLFPDLRSASVALSLVQLLAWVPLANTIGRTPRERTIALGFLWFHPAPLFVSFALWNQYLTVTTGALLVALLLRIGAGGRLAALPFAVLALMQPAIHLVHLSDLFVQLALLFWLVADRPMPPVPTWRCSRLVLLVALWCAWASGLAWSLGGCH